MLQESLLTPRPAWCPKAFRALGRYQFLTARSLAALLDTPVGEVVAGLTALVAEGLLVALQPTAPLRGPKPDVAYALTLAGSRLVLAVDGERLPVPNARRSLYLLAHELAKNEVGVVLEVLARRGHLVLHEFETNAARLADRGWIVRRSRPVRVPLVADALAVIEVNGMRTGLLLETDRGTVSVARMELKYRAYQAWWREGGPVHRYGLPSLRVVTIAPDRRRLERLREAALDATDGRGSGLFWFGEQSMVSPDVPERFLESQWTTARPGDPVSAALITSAVAAGTVRPEPLAPESRCA